MSDNNSFIFVIFGSVDVLFISLTKKKKKKKKNWILGEPGGIYLNISKYGFTEGHIKRNATRKKEI